MDDLVERVARAICSHHLAHVNHCSIEEVKRYIVDTYWNTPEYLEATHAAIAECQKWRPIKSAPKLERHLVDLWVVGPVGHTGESYGRRVTDCRYDKKYDSWIDRDGDWVTGRYFYDEEGEHCFDPADKSEDAAVATHWMPLPEPPKEK